VHKKNCRNKKYPLLQKRRKPRGNLLRKVVIREISMRMNSGPMSILRSSQFHVVGKRRMTNDEHPFSGILARLDISSMEPL
jgi:hypothetical protein